MDWKRQLLSVLYGVIMKLGADIWIVTHLMGDPISCFVSYHAAAGFVGSC